MSLQSKIIEAGLEIHFWEHAMAVRKVIAEHERSFFQNIAKLGGTIHCALGDIGIRQPDNLQEKAFAKLGISLKQMPGRKWWQIWKSNDEVQFLAALAKVNLDHVDERVAIRQFIGSNKYFVKSYTPGYPVLDTAWKFEYIEGEEVFLIGFYEGCWTLHRRTSRKDDFQKYLPRVLISTVSDLKREMPINSYSRVDKEFAIN